MENNNNEIRPIEIASGTIIYHDGKKEQFKGNVLFREYRSGDEELIIIRKQN